MASSSTPASSTLSRSRVSIVLLATLATACGIYYYQTTWIQDTHTVSTSDSSLHRSNAIHRRRRRNTTDENVAPALQTATIENDEDANIVAAAQADGETLLSDSEYQHEFGQNFRPNVDRAGQNTVQLLFRVSEDATMRNAYVHRGRLCNSCGVVPIRGIRYHCANCPDFDLCEGCEAQGVHTRTHIFYKIRVPVTTVGTRQTQPVWYTGDPDTKMRVLPKEICTKLSRETGLDRPELDAYWEQWTFMANTYWRDDPDDLNLAMDRKTFERCLLPVGGQRHAPPSLLFERMFAFYDTNRDDLIGFSEFVHGLAYRKKKKKWRKIFDGYDIDEDGFVDRKDFLRMFRSYYVLHKLMQRDTIQSLEDQQLSSAEVHSLINGRQPLSSAFGQDGRYPPAAEPRVGEGKIRRANGDLEIEDGRGVVNESGDDTGNRNDIFRRHLPRQTSWIYGRHGVPTSDRTGFWDALFSPPTSMDQAADLIDALTRARQHDLDGQTRIHHDESIPDTDLGADGPAVEDSEESAQAWPPTWANVTDEDVEAAVGPGVEINDVQPNQRQAVLLYVEDRQRARRLIHERWQRRQFYTDEEEGASPPDDWEEEEDILAQNELLNENKDAQSRPSMHSRSSSKVRFAEDMDDFDTRSNPSTSSRSVPERWGGMEIPDAEKDAGKEILYQITQQAFNELLDKLFKGKEDLAVEAAANTEDRDIFRPVYTQPSFVKKAAEKEIEEKTDVKVVFTRSPEVRLPDPPQFHEVEVEHVREHSIEELLATTGYTIEEPESDNEDVGDEEVPQSALSPPEAVYMDDDVESNALASDNDDDDTREVANTARTVLDALQPQSISRANSQATQVNEGDIRREVMNAALLPLNLPSPRSLSRAASPAPYSRTRASSSSSDSSYHDPTLPQFRPNAASPSPSPPHSYHPTPPSDSQTRNPPKSSNSPSPHTIKSPISQNELYRLWLCDKAADEAKKRNGWGRLDFAEFERVIKKHAVEGKPGFNEMDYLGSWIDFCIP